PALFGIDAGISARSVDQRKNRPIELLCKLHCSKRFAVAFGFRHPEVTLLALFGRATLLMSHDHTRLVAKSCEPRHDRRIVAETAVSLNLAKGRKNKLDVIHRVGPIRMSRQLHSVPRVWSVGLGGQISRVRFSQSTMNLCQRPLVDRFPFFLSLYHPRP